MLEKIDALTFCDDLKIAGWGRTLRDTGPESADIRQWNHKLTKEKDRIEVTSEFAPRYSPIPLSEVRSTKRKGKAVAVPKLAGEWDIPPPPPKGKIIGVPSEDLERAANDTYFLQQLVHMIMTRDGHWESNAATVIMILRSTSEKRGFRQPIYWNVAGPMFNLFEEADAQLAESHKMGARKAGKYKRKVTSRIRPALSRLVRLITMQQNMDDAYSDWHETSLGLRKKKEKITGKQVDDVEHAEVVILADIMPPWTRAADGVHGEVYGEDGFGNMLPYLDPSSIINVGQDPDEDQKGESDD